MPIPPNEKNKSAGCLMTEATLFSFKMIIPLDQHKWNNVGNMDWSTVVACVDPFGGILYEIVYMTNYAVKLGIDRV